MPELPRAGAIAVALFIAAVKVSLIAAFFMHLKMEKKLIHGGIHLKPAMDQSVYVRHSIESLVEEGVLGAILCSLVILIFLGEWRMTVIASASPSARVMVVEVVGATDSGPTSAQ